MPLFYGLVPGAIQTTNAAPLTANDCFWITAGVRNVWLKHILPEGRGALLTSISGITYRVEKWTTTPSSGGTALTPTPEDTGYQVAKQSAAWAVGTVTSGTGGPLLMLSIGSGTTSPGNWIAPTLDECPMIQGGSSASTSMDIFNASGAASLNFELSLMTVE
jgi:hypothetical protein